MIERIESRNGLHTLEQAEKIGLGTSYIAETEEKEAVGALEFAHEKGINYAGLATADAKTFTYYGKAFSSLLSRNRRVCRVSSVWV